MMLYILFLFNLLISGDLEITKSNYQLNFIYSNDNRFKNDFYLSVIIKNDLGKEIYITQKFENNKTSLKLKNDYLVAAFKVWSKEIEDNNFRNFWFWRKDDTSYNVNFYHSTFLMGSNNNGFNIIPDLYKAKNYLENEIKTHKNIKAELALNSLNYDLKLINAEKYKNKILEIAKNPYIFNKEEDLVATSKSLKTINEKDQAESLEKKFIEFNPNSEILTDIKINDLSKINNYKDFQNQLENLINKNKENEIISYLLDLNIKSNSMKSKLPYLINYFDSINFARSANYIKIIDLVEKDSLKNHFFKLSLLAIDKEIAQLESEEVKFQKEKEMAELFEKYAKYLSKNDTTKADEYFQKAISIYNPKEIPTQLIESYLEFLGTNSKAEIIIRESLRNSIFSDKIFEYGKKNFGENWEKISSESLEMAQDLRIANLKFEELNDTKFNGIFKKTDDSFYDPDLDKNKIKILYFFSTWCSPCLDLIESIEFLENEYSESQNVNLFGVDVWEDSDKSQNIKKLIDEISPKFTILLDVSDLTPQKYGVVGLPTTLVLDKDNNIKFRIEGFKNKKEYITKIEDIILYLNGNN